MSSLYIGLMSGTSLDGVDAVLVDLADKPRQLGAVWVPFAPELKAQLLALHQPAVGELHRSRLVGLALSRIYAQAVQQLLTACHLQAGQVAAIGCHGQTVRHCPEAGYSLQLGDGALLAELTGICVVNDFRSRDMAAGGQGAPLVPAFHRQLLADARFDRVIVNVGGISNLSYLPASAAGVVGFDCGPGNLLMDAWCVRHRGQDYDADGEWAAQGQPLPELLSALLNEYYFSLQPPKSTGRDLFNSDWLNSKLNGNERPQDVQASLLELTARCIADDIRRYCQPVEQVYLCGGGAHNRQLKKRLAELLPQVSLDTTAALGVDVDYLEAVAFAWLACRALQRQPGNMPAVTGAGHDCVLGAIYPA